MNKNANPKTKLTKTRPPNLDIIKEGTSPRSPETKANSTKHGTQSGEEKIPRNVNFYRHLILGGSSTENDIEWMLKLRSPAGSKNKLEPTSVQGFSFDGRGIEAQKLGRAVSDLDSKNQLHKVQHLFMHRTGSTANQGTVRFETGLRSYGSDSEKMRSLERTWRNEPKKDRNEYPKMYPSYEETAQIKSWSTKNSSIKTHSGHDGYLTLPKYGEQYSRQTKNVADVKHVLSSPGGNMSIADWQLSMRHYGDQKKPREFTEHEDERRTLGELRKINRKPKRI